MSTPNQQTFLSTEDFMFDINMVNGIEFRNTSSSKKSTMFIVFKNNRYIEKDCSSSTFNEISKKFIELLESSNSLDIKDYVIFNNVIFSTLRLTVIEYRDPGNGLRHLIQFKDGQYLLPYLTEEKFQELFKQTQLIIKQKESVLKGI